MASVRPMMNVVPHNESVEQRDAREFENFRAFNGDLNALIHAVDSQSPFIPMNIYRALEAVLEVGRREAIEVRVERQDRDRNQIQKPRARTVQIVEQSESEAATLAVLESVGFRTRGGKLRLTWLASITAEKSINFLTNPSPSSSESSICKPVSFNGTALGIRLNAANVAARGERRTRLPHAPNP